MTDELYAWLEKEFKYSNHKKYHKYFKEWVDNINEAQIIGFKEQMIGQLTGSKVER